MTYHDVITFHMDDLYGQHIHFHPLTIHIKFVTTHHYLQICYNPLQSAMWQHNNIFKKLLNIYIYWIFIIMWHNKKIAT
jgi:hypothetical protein